MVEIEACDVCVVGTGAGGGVLAYELAMAGLKVVSLEQGPLLAEDYFRVQDPPGSVKNFGIRPHTTWPSDPHEAFFGNALFAPTSEASAVRSPDGFLQYQVFAVGGLQNLWNGVSLRFSADDFASWPISYGDLAPHYTAVERLAEVCGTQENLPNLPDGDYIETKPFRPVDRLLAASVVALGDTDARAIPNRKAINTREGTHASCISTGACAFGCPVGAVYKFPAKLLPRIANRANYHLRPNAKVTRLISSADGKRVTAVEFLDTATGSTHRLSAAIVVLAAGAVESPRILFNSATERDPGGLGNRSDQLGRRLQDNPKSVLSTSLWRLWGKRRDFDVGYGDPLIVMGRGTLADGSTFPFIGHDSQGIPDIPHYLTGLKKFPPAIKVRLAKLMFNSYATIGLFCPGEPNPANRLKPGAKRDRFGIPQVEVDFTASPKAHQMMAAMEAWGRRVLRGASGTIIHGSSTNNGTGIHYAGTSAISADPNSGVVDANLRSHDFENLYVCDGGAIPSLPEKHLTLTIMALAHRLSGHIVREIHGRA
ncbi:GMC oxidoreductase [Acidisoma sp. S159]|uniref:GMC oxidoreductase n=1 Tax=Acidisoma sp. S159 TaxID=1747225 RepID=UPI001C204B56|nr:GMC family oxidoreductase [Acidisoma sp. S159]